MGRGSSGFQHVEQAFIGPREGYQWCDASGDPRTHDVRTLELTAVTGALLDEIARGPRPLADVVRSAARRYDAAVDARFLDALSAVLADFLERGLLLGSLAPGSLRTEDGS